MRRTPCARTCALLLACVSLALLAGCGRGKGAQRQQDLTFEQLADTAGLSRGAPILESFDAYRMENGALRVRGRARLPDGTRLHVALRHRGERNSLAMVQVEVTGGAFDSPPIVGESGPLPKGRYVFDITTQFLPEWQPPEVLRATDNGRSIRGPGITRTRVGTAMFELTQEMTR